jgi:hypothetical protein
MFFYWTIVDDLPDEEMVVLKPSSNVRKKKEDNVVMPNGHVIANGDRETATTEAETKKEL